METYLFYATHLIMTACIAVVISASLPENGIAYMKRIFDLTNGLFSFENLKERLVFKSLIINILTIGLQIATQLLR
ncbi:hypothetical protein [Mucilaginibacter sp. dw_454]|uniref:hypothetical protein n=1 Tax=Mucilaginibacter sp. dw_454 TaxID=2720079 RepID=UPI001BD5715B|nr:hypothetical protein [Mucilaginibacter sp. dw_454]